MVMSVGQFNCFGPCDRKRFTRDDFSNKTIDRFIKEGVLMKCKECVASVQVAHAAQKLEHLVLVSDQKKEAVTPPCRNKEAKRPCVVCSNLVPRSAYNKNQWCKKKDSKCRACVNALFEQAHFQSSRSQEPSMTIYPGAVKKSKGFRSAMKPVLNGRY